MQEYHYTKYLLPTDYTEYLLPTDSSAKTGAFSSIGEELSYLGQGFSALREVPKHSYPFGVPGKDYPVEVGRPPSESGEELLSSFQAIRSYEEVRSFLKVTGSGSYGSGPLSVSSSASYENNFKTTSLSITAVVSLRVYNANLRMGLSLFQEPTLEALKTGTKAFTAKYGDTYIAEQMMGGRLFGIFQYNARSEEEYRAVAASISGSYYSISGNAGFDSHTNILRQWKHATINIYRLGDDSPLPKYDPSNPDQSLDVFLQLASDFPKKVSYDGGKPSMLGWLLSDYQGITNRPDDISLDIRDARSQQQIIFKSIDEQRLAMADYELAIKMPDAFDPTDISGWQAAETVAQTNVEKLGQAIQVLADDPFKLPLPVLPQLQPLPARPKLRKNYRPRIVYSAIANHPPYGQLVSGINGKVLNAGSAGNFGGLSQFKLAFEPKRNPLLSFKYMCHISERGDVWLNEGDSCEGNIENIQILLQGLLASYYELKVVCYVDNEGWKTGGSGHRFGTPGHWGRIEAISVDVVSKA